MAERRMFAKTIVLSDAFLSMSMSALYLYFVLGIEAENMGLLRNTKAIARGIGCTHYDIEELIKNGFLLENNHDIYKYKIAHWYENNGVGETAKKRNNHEYRKWRQKVIERDGCCTSCGSKENLEAHHIKEFSKYPDSRLVLSNGITLCNKCHRNLHKERRKNNGNI